MFLLFFRGDDTKDQLQSICLLLYDLDVIQHLKRKHGPGAVALLFP